MGSALIWRAGGSVEASALVRCLEVMDIDSAVRRCETVGSQLSKPAPERVLGGPLSHPTAAAMRSGSAPSAIPDEGIALVGGPRKFARRGSGERIKQDRP